MFEPKYHLSVSYIARVIRVDTDIDSGRPVVAMRLGFGEVRIMRELFDRRVLGRGALLDAATRGGSPTA